MAVIDKQGHLHGTVGSVEKLPVTSYSWQGYREKIERLRKKVAMEKAGKAVRQKEREKKWEMAMERTEEMRKALFEGEGKEKEETQRSAAAPEARRTQETEGKQDGTGAGAEKLVLPKGKMRLK